MPPKRRSTPRSSKPRRSTERKDIPYNPPPSPTVPNTERMLTRSQARLTAHREQDTPVLPAIQDQTPSRRGRGQRGQAAPNQQTRQDDTAVKTKPTDQAPELLAGQDDSRDTGYVPSQGPVGDRPILRRSRSPTHIQQHHQDQSDNRSRSKSARQSAFPPLPWFHHNPHIQDSSSSTASHSHSDDPSETQRSTRKRTRNDNSLPTAKKVRGTMTNVVKETASDQATDRIIKLVNKSVPPRYMDFDVLAAPFSDLESNPRVLTLQEISDFFLLLQQSTLNFAREHFDFYLSDKLQQAWPLHELSTSYLPLMLVTQYIADGGQYTWRRFFTSPDQRIPLVYGILGEWFKQRIFKHTAFGMNEDEIIDLENVDRKYIHFDAFVKSKARAKRFREILGDSEYTEIRKAELHRAASELAEELMLVLTPLLPSPIFYFNNYTRRFQLGNNPEASLKRQQIKMELTKLIISVASLHRCIRLTGENGTIIRITQSVPRGGLYFEDVKLRMINKDMIDYGPQGGIKNSSIRVKMTCWGHVEAVVPHGPDALDLSKIEQSHRKELSEGEEFNWQKIETTTWPILPEGTPLRDSSQQLTSDSTSQDQPIRNSYVTIYPKLAGSDVYCEWAIDPSSKDYQQKTLYEAVKEARSKRGLSNKFMDQTIDVWNIFMDLTPTTEWLALGLGLTFATTYAINKGWISYKYDEIDLVETWNRLGNFTNHGKMNFQKNLQTLSTYLKEVMNKPKESMIGQGLIDLTRMATSSPTSTMINKDLTSFIDNPTTTSSSISYDATVFEEVYYTITYSTTRTHTVLNRTKGEGFADFVVDILLRLIGH